MKSKQVNKTVCTHRTMWVIVACAISLIVGFCAGMFVQYLRTPAMPDYAMICTDGAAPDENGCCPGEVYTDMGAQGFNCCPNGGENCFPPLK